MSIVAQDVVTIAVSTLLINVSDGAVATDVITPVLESNISVVEQPVAVDAVIVALGDLAVDVADAAVATDAPTLSVGAIEDQDINVTDPGVAKDLPTISIEDHEININDPTVAVDVPSLVLESLSSVTDPAVTTDAVIVALGDLQINVADSVVAADSPVLTEGNLEIDVSEQPSIADVPVLSVSVPGERDVNVSDSAVATDAPTLAEGDLEVSVNEQPTVADVPALGVPADVDVSDSVIVTDAPALTEGDLKIDVNESPTVADSPVLSVVAPEEDLNINVSDGAVAVDSPVLNVIPFLIMELTSEIKETLELESEMQTVLNLESEIVAGEPEYAIFNGIDSYGYISIPDAIEFNPGEDNYSFEAIITIKDLSSDVPIYSQYENISNFMWFFIGSNGSIWVQNKENDIWISRGYTNGGKVEVNTKCHIAISIDRGNSIKMAIGGVQQSVTVQNNLTSDLSPNSAVDIGKVSNILYAEIDIYSLIYSKKALTESEMLNSFNNGIEANDFTIALWDFRQGDGTDQFNNHDLILNNVTFPEISVLALNSKIS